jgi:hypothetical protein
MSATAGTPWRRVVVRFESEATVAEGSLIGQVLTSRSPSPYSDGKRAPAYATQENSCLTTLSSE